MKLQKSQLLLGITGMLVISGLLFTLSYAATPAAPGIFGNLFVDNGGYKLKWSAIVDGTIVKAHLTAWSVGAANIASITSADVNRSEIQVRPNTNSVKCPDIHEAIQSIADDGTVTCVHVGL